MSLANQCCATGASALQRHSPRSGGHDEDPRLSYVVRTIGAMSSPDPPDGVEYDLDEALELLAVLEDARDLMIDGGHLAGVVPVEDQVRLLSRRLGFDDPFGGPHE